ncbi:MAG TPA: class I SAM-dependent methyltransferase [Dongiaceae bacterium]|jgi:SAM-dependent methyltransferase
MTADEFYQQAFRNEIAALQPQSLCDIGCGAGGLIAHARTLGISGVGIEPDPARAAEAKATGADVREGAAESLPFSDASFDLVTFENSLHHVTDIPRALREAARVARRAIVIIDPWFDLSIATQATGDRFERWLKRVDRMSGMVHWDPIAAGEIVAALDGHANGAVAVRHLLHLTPLTPQTFAYLSDRAAPHMDKPAFAAAYRQAAMDGELAAIRAEVARTGITEAGALLISIGK